MSTPRVTVLMSMHNSARWLPATLESVLAQTFRDFEFLVLDDASTDESTALVEQVRDPRVRLIRLPENIGLTRALNVGLREARGEFIARQDADDLSAPERLARQVAFLDAHPEVAVVGAQGWLIDAAGRSRGKRNLPLEAAAVRWVSVFDNPVMHSAAMFRARVIREEFGGYDESFPTCQDYDLWTRVMERHEVRNLPERLVTLREHAGSISAQRREEGAAMVRRVASRILTAAGWADVSADLELVTAFRRHLRAEEVANFRSFIARWDAQRGGETASIEREKGEIFFRVGYNLLAERRLRGIGLIFEALQLAPKNALDWPWIRLAGAAVLGPLARKFAGR